ncbi:Protogenin B [Triplophysa rosa]|uniref:Immunoglobulin superfamily DCC subclass member 4 n=1 Tax=Triplophysa rosa TaxID=992332 RepID=A0A9W7WZN1_TRIRA|nr:Protogenin B [Triplophysa rosa]
MASVKWITHQRLLILFWIISFSAVSCVSDLAFVVEPSDVRASGGEQVSLDCLAEGEPPAAVEWMKDGIRVQESDRVQVLANGTLSITDVRSSPEQSDEGVYQCLAQNKHGAILSQRSRLAIPGMLSMVSQPVPVKVSLGSVVRFSCSVSGDAAPVITWDLNQRSLPLDSDRITILPNGALQIRDVTTRDAGKYRCSATNAASRVRSKDAELIVTPALVPWPLEMKPQIVAAPQNITVSVNGPAVLECMAEGKPRPLVSWSRADSKPIDVFGTKVMGNGNLVISVVKAHHGGTYLCRATTPGTRNYTTATATLTVLVPPSFVEKPETQTRPRAGTARFSCQAKGTPAPRISWFRNGQMISSNGRTKMYNSKLVITQIIPEDEAFYQCQAENSQGWVLSAARLVVIQSDDRPGAPRHVHAETISSSAILLAWERPQYNAEKVIAYSIHYTKTDGLNNEEYQAVIGNDTTSHIVDDLEPARNYAFYIVAYMPMGASRMSEQVTQHTLENVPLRTPEFSLTSRSPTDILVSWQPLPPKLSRGRVSAYRLSYRTAADEQVTSVELPVQGENSTQHLLRGLQADTIYLIRMSASTRVGWSQPSAWSSHRTPKTSSAAVPPAPNLELEPQNCTSVTVRWHPAPSDAVVHGYKLSFHPDSQSEDSVIQLPAQDHQYTIAGLSPRVKYHVKILAFSVDGDGYQAHQTVNPPACPSAPNRRLAALPPPDHVDAKANSSSAVILSWSRPAFSSGKPVSYSVRCGPVSPSDVWGVRYVQTTEQTVTLTGLRPNTRYEFAVRLHMDHMSSPWSATVYQKTSLEAPSSPPLGVKVSLIDDGTALVSWRPPDQPNLSVAHYTILYASQTSWLAGEWQVLQREGTDTMALLEKLESGHVYLVKISASNQAGDGPFSSTVELQVLRAKHHQSKNPRHTDNHAEQKAFIDGLYHIDEKSMTGIIIGVCIALTCIVFCVLVLFTRKSSSSSKMIGPVRNEVTHGGVSSASQLRAENTDVHVPMMRTHFIDAKGGAGLIINGAGLIMSDARSKQKRWNIFNNKKKSEAKNDTAIGKTVLRYEEEQPVVSAQGSSLHILYRPLGESESSQTSDPGSRETGDSGNCSQDETETSSPSGTSFRPDDPVQKQSRETAVCVVSLS